MTFELRNREIENVTPSFAGRWRSQLQDLRRHGRDVFRADVTDDAGDRVTSMTLELEELALLDRHVPRADAAIVALGNDVRAFDDADAFGASDASYLGDPAEAGDPPESAVGLGMPWPPRVAPESFISTGIFERPGRATAAAILHGTVIRAEMRTNALTGQPFHVVHMATGLFETDLCVAGSDLPAEVHPGMIVGGGVFMVASLQSWTPTSTGSWWRRCSIRQ
jgi:hypothetical protein